MERTLNLLIIGAGQYGQVTRETAQALSLFNKIEFLDDNSALAIGKVCEYSNFTENFANAFVAVGNSPLRLALIEKLKTAGYKIVTLIHPKAFVSPSATINEGCIVEPNATVSANSTLGIGCIIAAGAVVGHNSVIGNGCHLDCNSTVPSNKTVAPITKLNCGQVF